MIQQKIENILSDICEFYQEKLKALISICESPIEQIYLLDFIKFYAQNSLVHYSIEFLLDHDIENTIGKSNYSETCIDSSGFSDSNPKLIYGIKIKHHFFDLEFSIIPQYEIKCDDLKTYRVDFAIIGSAFSKDHIDKKYEFRFFIECDGHEFHKTPQQINKDNIRANTLKSIGWQEYRYSGKNIFSDEFSAAFDFDRFIMLQIQPINGLIDIDDETQWLKYP